MQIRTWISLVVGIVLFVATVMWSTGRIRLPGPFARLRLVTPEAAREANTQTDPVPTGDRGREFRENLVRAIREDRLVTMTVHVALCDSRMSVVDNPDLGRGNSPVDNLYWGAKYGLERFFEKRPRWRRLRSDSGTSVPDILRRVVFLRRVEPSSDWVRRGVTEPFDIAMLGVAWTGRSASDAMRATLMDALGLQPPTVVPVGGRRLRFGSESQIVGYMGYNAVKDDPSILPDPTEPMPRPEARGVFFLCPASDQNIGPALKRLDLHAILMTTDTLTPEAYILYGLTEALAAGQIEHGLADKAAEQYARYKRMDPGQARALFVP